MEARANKLACKEWIFDLNQKDLHHANDISFGRVKGLLYETLHRCITSHDLKGCYQLLYVLPRQVSLDPYALIRLIFILLESNDAHTVNKNVIIYLEILLSKLDVCKPDLFVEFLAYFIRHNRIDDASELYSQRQRYMSKAIHRELPFVRENLACYGFLLKYLQWEEKISNQESKHEFDKSIQGWVVNAIDHLKVTTANHEYFVMCVINLLLYYGYTKKAYLLTGEYRRNNPNNISAQILLLKLIDNFGEPTKDNASVAMVEVMDDEEKYRLRTEEMATINNFSSDISNEYLNTDYHPVQEEKKDIMKNLRRLDIAGKKLLHLLKSHDNLIEIFEIMMDRMEVVSEIKNSKRWSFLLDILERIISSNDHILITDACFLWQTKYMMYWSAVDFVALAGESVSRHTEVLIKKVMQLLTTKLGAQIKVD